MKNVFTVLSTSNLERLIEIAKQDEEMYGGYVYLIEWNDYVKIGSTYKPYDRISHLLKYATGYGDVNIKNIAVSKIHKNYRSNEHFLHSHFSWCRKEDTELFRLKFDTCLSESSDILVFDCISKEDELKERKNSLKNLKSTLLNSLKIEKLEDIVEIEESLDIIRESLYLIGVSKEEVDSYITNSIDKQFTVNRNVLLDVSFWAFQKQAAKMQENMENLESSISKYEKMVDEYSKVTSKYDDLIKSVSDLLEILE